MDRQDLHSMWEKFRLINGVTLRALDRIGDDHLVATPIPHMRSTRELIDHLYVYTRAIPEAVLRGRITAEDCAEQSQSLRTKADVQRYAREAFRAADAAVDNITDAHLQQPVETHWGPTMPGAAMMNVLYDEHLHHRGQLYAYMRALGIEPPYVWGFEENEPEFQPRSAKV
jgi:uncharacterized damage-inducible protein DinB